MKLTYIYHSGFAIEGDGFTLLIDYYKDSGSNGEGVVHDHLLHRTGKLYVLSTHSHPDHFNPEILAWKQERPDIYYIFSRDILENHSATPEDAVYLSPSELYRDNTLCIQAFGSTDIGCSFLIEIDGKRIFHAGDLNNWHWKEESTMEESKEYEDAYLHELEILARVTDRFDLVMFPIDPRLGREYMLGAEQFVCRFAVDCFAPMHFHNQYKKAAAFRSFAEENGALFISWSFPGETVELP
ncbi:MBL fold metallo-hydrolase [Coprobacter sp.]